MKILLRNFLIYIPFLWFSFSLTAQSGFNLKSNKRKDRIKFELVNNLPVVDVKINGTELSFILDTGVSSTILFSLETTDSLQLRNTTPVRLQGLGPGGSVEALRSVGNIMEVGNTVDTNHSLYVVFDSSLNFSPRMGIPIHGIMGNDFFENFIVKINYSSERITVYNPQRYTLPRCRRCEDIPLHFEGEKPFVNLLTMSDSVQREVTLLVDSGSSDVLWLFDEADFIKENPKNYFNDFLGLGLGGDIFGKRSRIPKLILGNFHLKNVNTSFPQEVAITRARVYADRDGSIGGGFLRRFTVTFDYGNKIIRFKKNRFFREPFHYNMSGLTLEQEGWELVRKEELTVINTGRFDSDGTLRGTAIPVVTQFLFSLAPRYVVVNVREGSAAYLAGIEKEDEVVSINGKPSYGYKLYELIDLFSSEEGRKITMEINRNGKTQKFKFYLKSVFQ